MVRMRRCGTTRLRACAAAALAWAGGAPARTDAPTPPVDGPYESLNRFVEALHHVRQNYVEASRTAYGDLVDQALRGMLSSLDEHSEFLSVDEMRAMQEDTAGQFGGIGVVVGQRAGGLVVIAPIDGTPGQRAGLRAGDRLVEIEGRRTEEMGMEDAVRLMRGPPGSRVRLRVARGEHEEPRELIIERAAIRVDSVKNARMLDGDTGYVRITQFDERTARLLDEALRRLESQGARALVLDLRNNPGGLVESAVDVCSRFLPRGRLVLMLRGRGDEQRQAFVTRGPPRVFEGPLVVLINEGSASAAEVVAGCLQDHRRALLVGERSFGKGSVQTLFPLTTGGALRLTTARYFTPNRRMIHDLGIEPDIRVPMSPAEFAALAGDEAGAPRPARDVQLERAADAVRGVLLLRRG